VGNALSEWRVSRLPSLRNWETGFRPWNKLLKRSCEPVSLGRCSRSRKRMSCNEKIMVYKHRLCIKIKTPQQHAVVHPAVWEMRRRSNVFLDII